MADRVCVGAIAGAFGVRGDVRLKSFCAVPEDIAAYGPLSLEDGSRSFTVKLTSPVKGGFAARLGGVTTKEAADALRGSRLYAPRDALPSLPDDEFYHADLIGLEVCDTGGKTPRTCLRGPQPRRLRPPRDPRARASGIPRSSPSRPRSCPPSTSRPDGRHRSARGLFD
jgi:hypothetical protein